MNLYYMSVNYKNKNSVLENYDFYYDVIDRRKEEEMISNGFVEVYKDYGATEYIIDYSIEAANRCYNTLSLYRYLYDILRDSIRIKNLDKILN